MSMTPTFGYEKAVHNHNAAMQHMLIEFAYSCAALQGLLITVLEQQHTEALKLVTNFSSLCYAMLYVISLLHTCATAAAKSSGCWFMHAPTSCQMGIQDTMRHKKHTGKSMSIQAHHAEVA
jgi:hypothetical protein